MNEELKQNLTDTLQIYSVLVESNREKYAATGEDRYLEILNEALDKLESAFAEAGWVSKETLQMVANLAAQKPTTKEPQS